MLQQFKTKIGDNEIILETGQLAGQAGGAVVVRYGDSMVLATATTNQEPREGIDFFPLTVDFEERLYAAGRIPGSFFRREGRPSENAILLCRITDRSIRPLFPKGYRNDVQIVLTALSADPEQYLDVLSILGASAALTISNVPWGGPIGAVRVGYVDGKYIFNPTAPEMVDSTLDLRMAGSADAIIMVEAGAEEAPEEVILEGLAQGHKAIQDMIRVQNEMREQIGKKKNEFIVPEPNQGLIDQVKAAAAEPVAKVLRETDDKHGRREALHAVFEQVYGQFAEQLTDSANRRAVQNTLDGLVKAEVRRAIIEDGRRPDGRGPKDVRQLESAIGLLPRAHGSGLFTRGETQALSIATLGTVGEEQRLDTLGVDDTKRYMHHYNFPPYSVGEVRRLGGPGRREIGHGALAERALLPVLPDEDEFPYAIRVVSETLASNGSSSMASVCGSTLSLMDAGVPIKAPVAGVAMGLITDGTRYTVLTDIQGLEDHEGDMDFKVAGTRAGITALQMDIKVAGIPADILRDALEQAHQARIHILDHMAQTIAEPRQQLSKYAPRIVTLHIEIDKIGALIGPGGKNVRRIQEEAGVKVDIQDDGTVYVAATDGTASDKAVRMIEQLTESVQLGKIYTGTVVRTTDFGAFVEILPGQDGLVHISQLADYRAPSVEDVVKVGDEVMVMVIDIVDGKVKLSRRAVMEGLTLEEARERDTRISSGGGDRRGGGGGDRRGGGGGDRRGGGGGGGFRR